MEIAIVTLRSSEPGYITLQVGDNDPALINAEALHVRLAKEVEALACEDFVFLDAEEQRYLCLRGITDPGNAASGYWSVFKFGRINPDFCANEFHPVAEARTIAAAIELCWDVVSGFARPIEDPARKDEPQISLYLPLDGPGPQIARMAPIVTAFAVHTETELALLGWPSDLVRSLREATSGSCVAGKINQALSLWAERGLGEGERLTIAKVSGPGGMGFIFGTSLSCVEARIETFINSVS
jgi:hypothetical protein